MPSMVTSNQIQNQQPNSPAVQAANQQQSAPANVVAFSRSGKKHIEQGQTQNMASGSWAAGFTQTFQVPTYGYMSELILTLNGTGGVNGTKTVAGSADAPWNLFSNILLTDVNGTPIINLDGYGWYLARLLGGYKNYRPDQSSYGFSAINSGSSGTGNFLFKDEFPIEFATDGLGCLPNMDASAQYRLNLTYNGPNTFYAGSSGAPGTVPSVSALLELVARNRPPATDAYGNAQATQPPAAGTVQYWTSQTFNIVSGQNTIQFTRVGNLIRNHILVFRDSSGTRAGADSGGTTPTVLEFDWDAGIRYKANVDTLRQRDYEAYGFDVPAGVIALPNTTDPTGFPGHEYGDEWMPTVGSTLLNLQFTTTAAGTLQVITNDIVPGSGSVYSAPSLNVIGA